MTIGNILSRTFPKLKYITLIHHQTILVKLYCKTWIESNLSLLMSALIFKFHNTYTSIYKDSHGRQKNNSRTYKWKCKLLKTIRHIFLTTSVIWYNIYKYILYLHDVLIDGHIYFLITRNMMLCWCLHLTLFALCLTLKKLSV